MATNQIKQIAKMAAIASRNMLAISAEDKRTVLISIAGALDAARDEIMAANAQDVADARIRGRAAGSIARLEITPERFKALSRSFLNVADLQNPVGEQVSRWIRPNGLEIVRVRVPIGVVGVAYESRPFVIADAAALCIKIGNSLVITGDVDSQRTGQALLKAIRAGGEAAECGLPFEAVQAIFTDDPAIPREMTRLQGLVDLVIPRGGRDFVNDIVEHASVPVLKHLGGTCSLFVDSKADMAVALSILSDCVYNEAFACNSIDNVIVHSSIALDFFSALVNDAVRKSAHWKPDDSAKEFLLLESSGEEDTGKPVVNISVVRDLQDAVDRINTFGSHVADTIVSEDCASCVSFEDLIDSACVCVNTSPRFADGSEFGMGAEIGFSTDKFHARGPLGLLELTSTKYTIRGNGQVRG